MTYQRNFNWRALARYVFLAGVVMTLTILAH